MCSFLKQDLKILAAFLLVQDNTEGMWNKATLNRQLSHALLSEKTDLHSNNFLSWFATSFTKNFLWPEGETQKISFISSLEDNAEYKCLKPTLNRDTPYAMLSK